MQHYALNTSLLQKYLKQKGYRNVADFVAQTGFNRMTIHHYQEGNGPFSETYYRLCNTLNIDPLELLTPVLSQNQNLHLDEILPLIKKMAAKYPPVAFGLFGSRAKGKAKKFSDWDIGITGGSEALNTWQYIKIKNDILDLAEDLPRSVDVIFLDAAPLWFWEEMDYTPIFLAGDEKSWQYFLGVLHGIQKKIN